MDFILTPLVVFNFLMNKVIKIEFLLYIINIQITYTWEQ